MKEILDFLTELSQNNNRNWFEANKPRYKAIQAKFDAFTEQLIIGIAKFDPTVNGLTVKDCSWRIYRDMRFSPNKEPYKTHIGAYICPKGKNSGYAGYYFHLEPHGTNYMLGNALISGLHCPSPQVLKSVRDEILDNGEAFLSAINEAEGFALDQSSKLKRTPKDFPQGTYYDEYLKLKEFDIMKSIPENKIDAKDFLEYCIAEFKKTEAFNRLLNRCVDFVNN